MKMKILFVWPNLDQFGFKPIGISILSALAKKQGVKCDLFTTSEIDFGLVDNTQIGEKIKMFKSVDFNSYDINRKKIDLENYFTEKIQKFNPDCLAFSALSYERYTAKKLASIAKKLCPDIPLIWGGVFATLNPELVLNEYMADYVCVGEGLEAFTDFLTALKENIEIKKIKNIWTKKNNKIIKTDLRPLYKHLDDLPYLDWEIFDKRHFLKPFDGKLYIGGDHMLNWGCMNQCSYCINQFYHGLYKEHGYKMRRYSTKRIVNELEHLKNKFNIGFFKFHDEDFLARPLKNLREFADEYKSKLNIPFVIMTNPKSVTKEKARILKDMNCVSVSMGIETGDPYLRKEILNRSDSMNHIVNAFKLFRNSGIRTSSFNMLAIPFETRETYQKTIDINRTADVQYPNTNFFYPFEGTKLRDIAIKEGNFNAEGIDKDSIYLQNKPALHFNNLKEREIIEMRNVFILYVKLPKEYEKFIRRSEIQDSIGENLRRELIKIYEKVVWENNAWYLDDGNKELYLNRLNIIMKS